MDFGGYLPFLDKELGGGADYDDPTMIPMGLAVTCRNMRFRKRSVRTRDGYLHTMSYEVAGASPFDFTGVEALDVLVNNPRQLVIALVDGGGGPVPIQITSVTWNNVGNDNLAIAIVAGLINLVPGQSITVSGCSNGFFDGPWTVVGVGTNTVSWFIAGTGSETGTGGAIGSLGSALLQESPTGSGSMTALATPIPVPIGASLQTTKAYNRIYMAFSDLLNALAPPMALDGPTGIVAPVSQNPVAAIWTPGRNYLVGDVVRTSQNPNRWFRCIVGGQAGNVEPTWPVLDGYFTPSNGAGPTTNIISVQWSPGSHGGGHSTPSLSTAVVGSTSGFTVGGSITVSGCSDPNFDGTFAIYAIGTNSISWQQSGLGFGENGTGGTIVQSTSVSVFLNPSLAFDPQGASQWVEWTPGFPQFLPAPEAPEAIISILGQGGAPAGTIPSGQDVYVCFAYQNANGESVWTQPIVYSNTANNDVLEVFFQLQNEVPGPTAAMAFNAAGYGGPRMPNWLMSVIGLSDPTLSWPVIDSLNVYVAAVTHGATAPSSFGQYASGISIGSPVVVSSIPSSTSFIPRGDGSATAGISPIPYIGEGGSRYAAVVRQDVNESLVPVDPGSPLLVNFTSSVVESGTANILFIQRSSNVVTCTVDVLAGFSQGSEVVIEDVDDTSFNGTFALTGVSPNQFGGATLIWSQTGNNGASTGGTATSANAANAFIVPQILIATIARVSDVVTAVVNSLQGLAVGTVIQVSGVTDTSFNGTSFTITAVTPNLGGGGSVTWAQTAADATSTGGVISPTGAGVGTNTPQNVSEMFRGRVGGLGIAGQVDCFFFTGKSQSPPPGFVSGAQITVTGVTPSDLNGTFIIKDALPLTTASGSGWGLTWLQAGSAEAATVQGQVTLIAQGTPPGAKGNATAIARTSGVVTATLDSIANFVLGGRVNVSGVTDPSYDGTFVITSINSGSSQLQWAQPGPDSSSSGGNIVQVSGGQQQPSPVAVLPPGGPFIAQDIAAFTVQDGSQEGPFTFIAEQDPITPFSASILSIGAVNGTVTALLSSASGLQPGYTVKVSGSTNGLFDGVFVLAQVNGNTVVFVGNGPGTGFAGGTLTLIPTQPTVALAQNDPVAITSMSRLASGVVSAQIPDVSNLEPGMRVQVAGATDSSFDGLFSILSVSQNQLPGSTTPLAGTVTWQSQTFSAASTTGGIMTGLPGIIFNPDDNELANADDVTAQLATIGAPNCADVFFSENLNMMVYTIGQDSSHYFSNPGDPANVATPGGILGVAESNGQRTVCFREMVSGELLSLKEKSGYEITPGSSTPNQYGVSRRWGASGNADGHGPAGPRAVDVADDFLIYFDPDSGPYRYHQGVSQQVGPEKQGTWDRITKSATRQICVAIDNVRKEVHFGLPLDGSTVPNHDIVLNYFNGWEEPLMLTMTGELMPNPHGRRWSDNDGATNGGTFRLIKIIKRTLTSPPEQTTTNRQLVFCLTGAVAGGNVTANIDMSVPNQFNDNGQAIDWQYQPAFAQSPTCEKILWDKMKGRVLGGSMIDIQPVTEDPESENDIKDVPIDVSDGLPDSFQIGMSETVNELFSIIYSGRQNGTPVVGAWGEIHRSVRYGKVKSSGTPR